MTLSEQLIALIKETSLEVSTEQVSLLIQYVELLNKWNKAYNLTSIRDPKDMIVKHIMDSLMVGPLLKGQSFIDVGTGPGLPGIPLAILFPNVDFLLVDSIGKKINVVNEVSASIGLANIRTMHVRAESIKETFDFVVSRAVTNITDFKKLVKGRFNKIHKNTINNGILYLKGGDLSEEFRLIPHTQYEISNFFEEDFFETKKVVYISY